MDVCPVDCIHEVARMLVIDPEECIDCGACEPECPVEAITPEDAVPDRWTAFIRINYAYPDGMHEVDALVQQQWTTARRPRSRATASRRGRQTGAVVDIRLKRAYEPASPADGSRVLVDRRWPRGVSKQQAKLDDWQKDLAPSTELRQ